MAHILRKVLHFVTVWVCLDAFACRGNLIFEGWQKKFDVFHFCKARVWFFKHAKLWEQTAFNLAESKSCVGLIFEG